MLDVFIIWGLGFLGMALYAFMEIWKVIKLKDFDHKKFFGENIRFWIVCVILNFIISIILIAAPEFKDVLHTLGFAVDDKTNSGFILLGFALAAGTNSSKITGDKTLIKKK